MSGGDDQPRGKRERPVECTAYLPVALKQRVRSQAAREQRSESDIVREALRRYFAAPARPAASPPPNRRVWPTLSLDDVVAATGAVGTRPPLAAQHRRRRRRRCAWCCRRLP